MMKTFFKAAVFIVGVNLMLVFALFLTEATHGINDQDASFLLAMIVYTLNKPAISAFQSLGVASEMWTLVVGGTIQWAAVSAFVALIIGAVRSKAGFTHQAHGEAHAGTSDQDT